MGPRAQRPYRTRFTKSNIWTRKTVVLLDVALPVPDSSGVASTDSNSYREFLSRSCIAHYASDETDVKLKSWASQTQAVEKLTFICRFISARSRLKLIRGSRSSRAVVGAPRAHAVAGSNRRIRTMCRPPR